MKRSGTRNGQKVRDSIDGYDSITNKKNEISQSVGKSSYAALLKAG